MCRPGDEIQVLKFPAQMDGDNERLNDMVAAASGAAGSYRHIDVNAETAVSKGKLLLAVECDEIGGNEGVYRWLRSLIDLYSKTKRLPLMGCTAAVLVDSKNRYYTKRLAQYLIFHMNRLGCRFIGQPVVEAVDRLQNFKTWQKVVDKPLHEILMEKSAILGERLAKFEVTYPQTPKLLVLHSSSQNTSNTLKLWELVAEHLEDFEIKEYKIKDDKIAECKGCSFKTCMHYSEIKSCYYGGMMVDEILPAMEWADAVIWVCPNYNDAISAKLMAVINRMTVLYRRITFYDKRVFGIVVSGNSGSDLVITQLLGAVSINKGYMLPPQFGFSAIANDPLSILAVEDIGERTKAFAQNIINEFDPDCIRDAERQIT